jgi:superfamily II RNA helicase
LHYFASLLTLKKCNVFSESQVTSSATALPQGVGAHVIRQETIEEIVKREHKPSEAVIPLPQLIETTNDETSKVSPPLSIPSASASAAAAINNSHTYTTQKPSNEQQTKEAQPPPRDELSEERKLCQHEICVPEGWTEPEPEPTLPKKAPAKTYPFELDPFQKVHIALKRQTL